MGTKGYGGFHRSPLVFKEKRKYESAYSRKTSKRNNPFDRYDS